MSGDLAVAEKVGASEPIYGVVLATAILSGPAYGVSLLAGVAHLGPRNQWKPEHEEWRERCGLREVEKSAARRYLSRYSFVFVSMVAILGPNLAALIASSIASAFLMWREACEGTVEYTVKVFLGREDFKPGGDR